MIYCIPKRHEIPRYKSNKIHTIYDAKQQNTYKSQKT